MVRCDQLDAAEAALYGIFNTVEASLMAADTAATTCSAVKTTNDDNDESTTGSKCDGDAELTVYHSRELPSVPLRALPYVLLGLCPEVTIEACVAALVLLERYAERVRPVEATMMHRLFVGCAVVAMKSVQEFFPRNSYVAGRMGIGRWEVNRLEAAVLRDLDWRVVVTLEELDRIVLRRCATDITTLCDSPPRCRGETPELAVMPTPAASSLATSQDVSPGATASASGRAAAAPASPMSPLAMSTSDF
jgi:hypothetical protein